MTQVEDIRREAKYHREQVSQNVRKLPRTSLPRLLGELQLMMKHPTVATVAKLGEPIVSITASLAVAMLIEIVAEIAEEESLT
jgi:hypothetical protein